MIAIRNAGNRLVEDWGCVMKIQRSPPGNVHRTDCECGVGWHGKAYLRTAVAGRIRAEVENAAAGLRYILRRLGKMMNKLQNE